MKKRDSEKKKRCLQKPEVLSLDRVILSLVVRLVQKMCVKKSEKKKLKKVVVLNQRLL